MDNETAVHLLLVSQYQAVKCINIHKAMGMSADVRLRSYLLLKTRVRTVGLSGGTESSISVIH